MTVPPSLVCIQAGELARAADARRRARLDHTVWRLGSKIAAKGDHAKPPPPPGSDEAGPEDGLADWLTNGGTR
jgi:hypothetical protein